MAVLGTSSTIFRPRCPSNETGQLNPPQCHVLACAVYFGQEAAHPVFRLAEKFKTGSRRGWQHRAALLSRIVACKRRQQVYFERGRLAQIKTLAVVPVMVSPSAVGDILQCLEPAAIWPVRVSTTPRKQLPTYAKNSATTNSKSSTGH